VHQPQYALAAHWRHRRGRTVQAATCPAYV
jgi:hypothetical protein